MKIQLLCLALVVCLSYSLTAQTTIVLTANADAAIGYHDFHNTADNNYGDAVQNAAYIRPGNLGGLNVNRALIHFDLSTIPPEAVITSAKLSLFALGPSGPLDGHTGLDNSAVLQRVTEHWTDSTVTWNNQPQSTSQHEVVLPESTDPLQDYTDIDITDLIEDLQLTDNFGFLLKQITENPTNILLFASLDCGDENKFPILEITLADDCIDMFTNTDAAIGYHDFHNTSGNNYGTAIQNAAYVLPGNLGGLNVNRALIYFNLATIPTGATVTSAKLNLYATGPISDLPGHVGANNSAVLQRVTENWIENVVTWDSQPISTAQNEVILPTSTSPLQDYMDIDVSDLITDMIATNNFGFILKLIDESPSNGLLFYSSDHPDSLFRPKLEICYSPLTSLDDNRDNADVFQVFPIPSSGSVNVTFNGFSSKAKPFVEVYSMTGEFLMSLGLENETITIDLEGLPSGVYLLKLVSINQSITKRIVLSGEK